MSDSATLLEQLRDVQEPLPPEGVPFWLIAANIAVACLIVSLLIRREHQKRNLWRTQLIKDLRHMRKLEPEKAISQAATTLRQLTLSRGHKVHSLSGDDWLEALDQHFDTTWFSQDQGQLFGDALYQSASIDNHELDTVFAMLERLIKTLPSRYNAQQDNPS